MARVRTASLCLVLVIVLSAGVHAAKQALVVYDGGTYRGYGDLFGQCCRTLLSHFDYTATAKPVEQYVQGDCDNFDAVFYVGTVYDHPLPGKFLADVVATDTTVCWIASNVWEVAKMPDLVTDNPTFVARTGMRYVGYGTGYNTVHYKGQDLGKDLSEDGVGLMAVVDASKARAYATISVDAGAPEPYITRGGHFWYVGDNPYSSIGDTDRYLAFCDVLHDMLGVDHPEQHRALVRFEDVTAITGTETLHRYADFCASRSVNFMISVIPEFHDPFGVYTGPKIATLDTHPEFADALAYCESKGGRLLVHGLTHQYMNTANPINGLSGVDYEFYTIQEIAAGGNQIDIGPVPLESPFWVRKRVSRAADYLERHGLTPFGWNTPHYMASRVDYREIARQYPRAVDRLMVFATEANGSPTYTQLPVPFVIPRDIYGHKRLPEDMGYCDPNGSESLAPPSVLVERARAIKVVRDGFASFYFHPFLDITYLDQIVTGLQAEGYTFVDPATL